MSSWPGCCCGVPRLPPGNWSQGAKKKDTDFYEGQVKTAQFFIECRLPITMGKMNAIGKSSSAAVDIKEAAFGDSDHGTIAVTQPKVKTKGNELI